MAQQTQLALFDDIPSVEILLTKREDQWFDRKSILIAAHKLASATRPVVPLPAKGSSSNIVVFVLN